MLEEILKKESWGEEHLKVIGKHFDLLTHEQKVKLGFEAPTEVESVVVEEEVPSKNARAKKK
jgi:hypothetical protein